MDNSQIPTQQWICKFGHFLLGCCNLVTLLHLWKTQIFKALLIKCSYICNFLSYAFIYPHTIVDNELRSSLIYDLPCSIQLKNSSAWNWSFLLLYTPIQLQSNLSLATGLNIFPNCFPWHEGKRA